MKAISYLRFSTPEQALGNSTERQLKAARDYCARNGLELDEDLSIADEGLSGYKGHNVERGSLGHFLNEVRAGKIPTGTALIIENLDRLSRQGINVTTDLLKQLTRYGIDVHVIAINRVLKAGFNNSLVDYMLIGVQADLAYQESKKKSERVGSAWPDKKSKLGKAGEIYTRNIPKWLTVENGKIVENPEVVSMVREAYRMAANGIGVDNITRTIGGKFSRSWFARLLNDRSVLGEFQPKGADAIQNFFPQVISQSDFNAVRLAMEGKRRNGRYAGGNRQRSTMADHLFSGLIFDLGYEDDAPVRAMHFQKVERGTYLMSAFDKTRKQNRIRYNLVESAVLQFLRQEDWQAIAGQSESEECKTARAELETLLREIDVIERRVQKTNSAMDAEDIEPAAIAILASRIAKDESTLDTLASRKDALQANVETACRKCVDLCRPEVLLDLIGKNTPEANDIRLRLRAELRKRIARIALMFVPDGAVAIDGLIVMSITYVNGIRHLASFRRGDNTVILIEDIQGKGDVAQRVKAFLDKRAAERALAQKFDRQPLMLMSIVCPSQWPIGRSANTCQTITS
jgi:DNA invertase Pin-like site-specific DNA recombinase